MTSRKLNLISLMKRQILLVSVAVLVNHAVMTWGAGEEAVGLAVSLESRAATTNRAKIGIAEYTSACGEEFLRKVYRTEIGRAHV